MERRLTYLSRCYRNLASAGNKAKTDTEATMQSMGFRNIGLPQCVSSNGLKVFFYDLAGVVKACCSMRCGDILVLQYPVKKYFSLLCNAAHLHGGKVVALVHDLGSMRRKKLTIKKEISRMSHADYIIATNAVMEKWLHDKGLKVMTGSLGLWDYLSDARPDAMEQQRYGDKLQQEDKKEKIFKITYAGSLTPRKNSFFMQLPTIIKGYELHVYGNAKAMPTLERSKGIVLHEFTPADEFIRSAQGDFGLVWDGDSLDACTGSFGGYLRYNTPHKVSFYIRAGLPIIIWKDAALAKTIIDEGIGITIPTLRALPATLSQITADEMATMRRNVQRVANDMSHGKYFKTAVEKAIEACSSNI